MLDIVFIAVSCLCSTPVPEMPGLQSETVGSGSPTSSLDLDQVKATGWLGERVDRAHRAIQNLRSSIWWDQGEVWGYEHAARWLRNMSLMADYTGYQDTAIPEVIEHFLVMSESGELDVDYAYKPSGAYTDGEVIRGFLASYKLTGDKRLLEAAIDRGHYIARKRTPHYYTSIAIGPLLALSAAADDPTFKELAVAIAEENPLPFLNENAHGAAVAATLDGYLDLYRLTGKRHYLDWALQGWQATRDRMFVTGGLGESLDFKASPDESDVMCETCQVSWWLMFNLDLGRITGDVIFYDMAERILFNHFMFSQAHRGEGGGFLAFGDIDQGVRGIHNYYCCDNEGTLGLLELLQNIYTQNPEQRRLHVNLFIDSEAQMQFGDQDIHIRQTTNYPERGVTTVRIATQAPTSFELGVRIPRWTRLAGVYINEVSATYEVTDSILLIKREWADGDAVKVVFPLPMRVETDQTGRGLRCGTVRLNGEESQAKRIAVFYGPIIAAMFRTGHANDLNWIWTGDYTDVLDCGGDARHGYAASRSDLLEQNGEMFESGGVPALTEIVSEDSAPTLSWRIALGDQVQVQHHITVLPGLPVIIEAQEEILGWNGKDRLLCSGLRFATAKDADSGGYGVCSIPYPAPCVTTKPDLDNHVLYDGIYGMFERLSHNGVLPTTGTFYLNNGYFGAICLYDPEPVKSVVCLQTDHYTGLYFEPKPGSGQTLTKRLVFPLADRPHNQTAAKDTREKATRVTVQIDSESSRLILTGPVLRGAPVMLSKSTGLQAGWTIHNSSLASDVLNFDEDTVVVYADVPGEYEIKPNP